MSTDSNHILVAIAFDENTDTILKSALALCKKLDKEMSLVHVCEPLAGSSYLLPYFEKHHPEEFEDLVHKSAPELARQKLTELTASIDHKINITVRKGKPASELADEAEKTNPYMVLIGTGVGKQRLMPKAWSTTVSLIGKLSVPLMILDLNESLDLAKPTLMVPDDLEDHTKPAVAFAAVLGRDLKGTHLLHVHATDIRSDHVGSSLGLISGFNETQLPKDIHDGIHQDITKALTARYKENPDSAAVNYEPLVGDGDPVDFIDQTVREKKPTILMFGNHQLIHHRPFALGRVPFSSMASFHCPMVIVPS